jgi:hypothetical protein
MLIDEWTHPKNKGEPLIVIEGQQGQPTHIYVIWDAWGDLDLTERSEIIMDVVEHLPGKHRLPDTSLVTVAMGLTKKEARRMHIRAA